MSSERVDAEDDEGAWFQRGRTDAGTDRLGCVVAPQPRRTADRLGYRPEPVSSDLRVTGVSYEPEWRDSTPGGARVTAPYTQHELEAMLADLESDLVERKESLRGDNPRKIRQAVCAFANDLPDHQRPGVVFVGADDAGAPVGLEITDELLLQLADVKTDGNIVPPPTLTVDKRVLLGGPVAVVTVMPSDTPAGAPQRNDLDPRGAEAGRRQRPGRTDSEREAAASRPPLRCATRAHRKCRGSRSAAFRGGVPPAGGRRDGPCGERSEHGAASRCPQDDRRRR